MLVACMKKAKQAGEKNISHDERLDQAWLVSEVRHEVWKSKEV